MSGLERERDLTRFANVSDLLEAGGKIFHCRPKFYVSRPTKCECGSFVRLLGEVKVQGNWICPVCGARYPYAFWKIKSEPGGPVVPVVDDLILALGEGACHSCGEANPPCRCERKKKAE